MKFAPTENQKRVIMNSMITKFNEGRQRSESNVTSEFMKWTESVEGIAAYRSIVIELTNANTTIRFE